MAGSPFVVTITEQRRNPGVQRPVHVAGPLAGLGTSAAAVPADAEVAADLALEAMTDGRLTATGRVSASWRAECRRCLRRVEGTVDVTVQEVFEPNPAPDAETYELTGDRIDLEPMVRDAVLLSLPLAPLCEESCAGPAPDAHPVGADEERDPEPDPRWSALSQLEFD